MNVPKVFISYSHDTLEHKKWVLDLAIRLRNNGIDATLDQFELKPGDDIPHFMETHLSNSDKVLMICTENYVNKANKGEGGVGYEKMIITSALMKRIDENKIIPIIRQIDASNVPTFLKSKLYINFQKDDDFEFSYDELVRTIHNSPLFEKPKIGNNPFNPIPQEDKQGNAELIKGIMKLLSEAHNEYDDPQLRYVSDSEIMSEFKMSRILAEMTMNNMAGLGLVFLNNNTIRLTSKGKLYLVQHNMA